MFYLRSEPGLHCWKTSGDRHPSTINCDGTTRLRGGWSDRVAGGPITISLLDVIRIKPAFEPRPDVRVSSQEWSERMRPKIGHAL